MTIVCLHHSNLLFLLPLDRRQAAVGCGPVVDVVWPQVVSEETQFNENGIQWVLSRLLAVLVNLELRVGRMKNLFPAEEYVGQKKLSTPIKIKQRTSVESKCLWEKRRTQGCSFIPDGVLVHVVVDSQVGMVVLGERGPQGRDFAATVIGITGREDRRELSQIKTGQTTSYQSTCLNPVDRTSLVVLV